MKTATAFLAFGVLLTAQPLLACSMSSSPSEIRKKVMAEPGLMRVKGTFRIDQPIEQAPYGEPFLIRGTITTERGTKRKVWLHYMDVWVQCGVQFTPPQDAKGVFWISRKRTDKRHEMRLWEGEYLAEVNEPARGE